MRANLLFLFVSIFAVNHLRAQDLRVPVSAVPFLTFAPDARGAAMGQAGVALSPDANATFWNPAKLASAERDFGASVSYTPWLSNVKNTNYWIGYASAYKKLRKGQAVGGSVKYFRYDSEFGITPTAKNSDIVVSGMYSRQLGNKFSLGLALKYISSDVGNGIFNGAVVKTGRAVAGDLSAYYRDRNLNVGTGKDISWSFGAVLANIGNKIGYGIGEKMFLPATIKIGGAFSHTATGRHRVNVVADVSKFMVPTPLPNENVNRKPVVKGMLGSFSDSPDGFKEELQEIAFMFGAEYWYKNSVALRAGYHGENEKKGNQKFYTVGAGARIFEHYGVDFSYLFPIDKGSPLKSTLRISVSAYLSGKNDTDKFKQKI